MRLQIGYHNRERLSIKKNIRVHNGHELSLRSLYPYICTTTEPQVLTRLRYV
jgi:hypothetical protein